MNFLSDDVLTTGAGLNTSTNTGGLEGLLQNKLFLQYLSGTGSALQQGQPVGPALDKVTQGNISAQNYAKILSKLLGPDESKGTFSSKGLNLTIPASELKSGAFLGDNPLGISSTQNPTPTPTPAQPPSISINPNQMGVVNPFAGSPLRNISASDLAGLTTQDLSTILSGALSVEQLKQKKVSDVVDTLYKQKQMEHIDSQIGEKTPSITIPGTDIKLTRDEYIKWYAAANKDERTAAVKNYEYAKSQGFKGDFAQFQDMARTTNKKDFDEAVLSGYKGSFNQWMLDMKRAGATNISLDTKLTEKKAMSELGGQLYFNDPKWTTDLNKHMEKADFANVPGKGAEYMANVSKAKAKEKVNFIESKIIGGGGSIVGVKKEGKMGIWTVKWPSGDTKEIRYGLDE